MEPILPLTTIGIILIIAMAIAAVVKKLGQNSVLGFIIAGFLLGPFWLNFLNPTDPLVIGFAELGLFVLLFYLGLELSLKDFLKAGSTTFGLALIDMFALAGSGALIMLLLGFSPLMALVVGIMLFSSSTAISAKFAIDRGIMHQPSTQTALAILILQDFLGILVLVFILSLGASGSALSLSFTALMFAVAAFVGVRRLSLHVQRWMQKNNFGHAEITLYGLGIGLTVATLGTILGLSPALGAYFAGFALAETKAAKKIKKDLGFMRDFFLVFFFVAFGASLFFNPELGIFQLPILPEMLALIGIALLVIVVSIVIAHGFVFSVFGGMFGLNKEEGAKTAMLLTPLGEFVVIIATASAAVLQGTEATLIAPIAFLLILITMAIFFPLYKALPWYLKISNKLPQLFPSKTAKPLAPKVTPKSVQLIQGMAVSGLTILSLTWIAFMLYETLPNFGVPIPYSREITTVLVWLLFISWPVFRILKVSKRLAHLPKEEPVHHKKRKH